MPIRTCLAALLTSCLLAGCSSDEETAPVCDPATLEHQTIAVSGYDFHVAVRGCGPPVLLMHGFPEFAYAWEGIQERLSLRFRSYAPDLRGVDLSEGPDEVAGYRADLLIEDGRQLLEAIADEPVMVVAHDWGGIIAWGLASQHPEVVEKLVILNSPHPDVFRRELSENPEQQQASSYMNLFISDSAEATLSANDYGLLADIFMDFLSPVELARYREGWSREGSLTRALNWYRANIDQGPMIKPELPANLLVDVPTLVLWGMLDDAILPSNLVGLEDYVSDLRIQELPDSDHWVAHREPDVVAEAITNFAAE
jgi:epoxide hydrolase 4